MNPSLDFIKPVKFSDSGRPIEKGLLNEFGKLSGRAQSAVRPISPSDFNSILAMGLEDDTPLLPRRDDDLLSDGFSEKQSEYVFEQERERVLQLTSRVIRDRVFRKIVLKAYDERCSFTGLKLINGGGRAEVDAAHIKPVEHSGPDVIGNGIALSGTAHWMFDRGLISLSDQFEILISRCVNDDESVRSFINRNGHAIAPLRAIDRPHPHFLSWHRQNIFKQ
ncbi:MAG: HNH endonuclease [Hyphomicrobiales bacterium]